MKHKYETCKFDDSEERELAILWIAQKIDGVSVGGGDDVCLTQNGFRARI